MVYYIVYIPFLLKYNMILDYVVIHRKVVFSLYRSKLRVAHKMGYKYGSVHSSFIQDLSLVDTYIKSGILQKFPNKSSRVIGSTIKTHYRLNMYYPVFSMSDIFLDRGFYWLRMLNTLYIQYQEIQRINTPLLPSPPKREENTCDVHK